MLKVLNAVKRANPGPLNIHCSRPGGLNIQCSKPGGLGLAGQALSQKVKAVQAVIKRANPAP